MNTKWKEELGKRIGEIMAHQGVTQPLLSYQTFAKDLKELGQMIEEMAKEYQSRMSETRTELADKSDMPEKPEHWDNWSIERQLGYNYALNDMKRLSEEPKVTTDAAITKAQQEIAEQIIGDIPDFYIPTDKLGEPFGKYFKDQLRKKYL